MFVWKTWTFLPNILSVGTFGYLHRTRGVVTEILFSTGSRHCANWWVQNMVTALRGPDVCWRLRDECRGYCDGKHSVLPSVYGGIASTPNLDLGGGGSVAQSCLILCHPWTAACQASLSFAISGHLLKLMSIESVMLSNHLIHLHLLLLPSVSPRARLRWVRSKRASWRMQEAEALNMNRSRRDEGETQSQRD